MRFADIVGHENAKAILQRFYAEQKIPHALLFHGKEGVGKRTTALAFFSLINCVNPTNDHDSCGECHSCKQISALSSPDLYVIQKAEEKTVIGIDVCRDVLSRTFFKPVSARYRCILLDNAHFLSPEAGNAMLKVLEEPPRNNIFVLVTDCPDSMLPTIVSRCCALPFGALSEAQVLAVLKRVMPEEEEQKLVDVSMVSKGSVSRALSMLKSGIDRRLFMQGLVEAVMGDDAKRLNFSRYLVQSKDSAECLIDFLKIVLQDILSYITGNEMKVSNKDLLDEIRPLARTVSLSGVLESLQTLHQYDKNRSYSPNLQVTVDCALTALAQKNP
jgi:DNA polymerase-3 subunit delta'